MNEEEMTLSEATTIIQEQREKIQKMAKTDGKWVWDHRAYENTIKELTEERDALRAKIAHLRQGRE